MFYQNITFSMKKFLLTLLAIYAISLTSAFSQAYKIELKVNGIKDSSVYLAYHFGNKKYVKDTLRLNSQGAGIFTGNEKLPGGIYLVVLPGMNYFEILVTDNQNFKIETSATDPVNKFIVHNSPENITFNQYQRFMAEKQANSENIQQRMKANSENRDTVMVLQAEMKKLDKEVKDYWTGIINKNQGSLIAKIIKGMMNVEIPEFEIPKNVSNKDSLRWVMGYNYNKNHYFDNIDFTEEKLLRTPILHNRLEHFFTRMLIQRPDSIIPQAVKVIELSRANEKVYQYVLVYLLNYYETSHIMGLDEVFVYLAEKYYLSGQALWANSELLDKLSTRVQRLKPTLIGRVATDLRMQTQQGNFINLHQIKAKYTVLYFYEPGCGHCKTVTPELFNLYKKYKAKGLEVFSVYILDDKNEWIDYTTVNKYDWINVYDPSNASFFRYYYDVYSTPVIYMLDKNKKIIAKRIDVETVESILKENLK